MADFENTRDSADLLPTGIFDDDGERHEMPTTHAGNITPLSPPLLQDAVSTAVQDLPVQDLMDMTMSGDAWTDFDWSNFFPDIPMLSTENDLLASSEALIADARCPEADACGLPLFNDLQPFSDLASEQLAGTQVAGSAWSLGVETPEHQHSHQTPATSGESSLTSSPGSLTDSTESQSPSESPKSQDPKDSLPYQTALAPPAPWGSKTFNGQQLFSYTPKGQWLLDRCFDKAQLREYVTSCPRETIFWLQQAPTKCGDRLDPEDRICRYSGCPVFNRRITAGWLRVAFDEAPAQTSDGTRDPLKVAGCMHLWCFEQVLDPLEFHLAGRLRPEARAFPREARSVVTLEKSTDAGIIREAYLPWMEGRAREWRAGGPVRGPRAHGESLSFAMNRYHLDNQTAARQKARLRRNAHKTDAEKRTIDVHQGDLGMFSRACRKAKHIRKCHKLDDELAETAGSEKELCSPPGPGHPRIMMSASHGLSVCGGQSLCELRERSNDWSKADQGAWAPIIGTETLCLMPDSARAVSGSPTAAQAPASASGRHPRGDLAGDSSSTSLASSASPSSGPVAAAKHMNVVACSVAQRGEKRLREEECHESLDSLEEQSQLPAKRQRMNDDVPDLDMCLDDEYLAQLLRDLNQDSAPQSDSDASIQHDIIPPVQTAWENVLGSDEAGAQAQADMSISDLLDASLFGDGPVETVQQDLFESPLIITDEELASMSLWGPEDITAPDLLDDALWPSEQIDSQFWTDVDLQDFFTAPLLGDFEAQDFLADVGADEAEPGGGGQDSGA